LSKISIKSMSYHNLDRAREDRGEEFWGRTVLFGEGTWRFIPGLGNT
jgi:hypothetical protein